MSLGFTFPLSLRSGKKFLANFASVPPACKEPIKKTTFFISGESIIIQGRFIGSLKTLRGRLMDKEPLISILTPVYNQSLYIEQTLRSVLNQTYRNWEWIVIDDGST